MALANIGPLSETFVDRMREEELYEQEPPFPDPDAEEELGPEEEPLPDEEFGPEEEPVEGGGEMDPVELVTDITSAIVQHFQEKGVDLDIDVAEEGEPGAEEVPVEEPVPEEEPMPEEEPVPEDELMEEDDIDGMFEQAGITLEELDDDIINEVTLRVARRLIAATKKK